MKILSKIQKRLALIARFIEMDDDAKVSLMITPNADWLHDALGVIGNIGSEDRKRIF